MGSSPFDFMILHIRHVSDVTDTPLLFFMILSAEMFISLSICLLIISILPRFLEMYWHTAAGVIPSFSAASFCVSPKSVIMLSAISFLIAGRPFQIMYSHGVCRIAMNVFFDTYS